MDKLKAKINELEKLKREYPKYCETIDEIIRLTEKGQDEAVLVILTLFNIIQGKLKGELNDDNGIY